LRLARFECRLTSPVKFWITLISLSIQAQTLSAVNHNGDAFAISCGLRAQLDLAREGPRNVGPSTATFPE
jgi:hypothetical protein